MTAAPGHDPYAALAALAETRRAELVRVAQRILRDDAESEDVVQDTLAVLWQRKDTLVLDNAEAYLFRAVQINALKRRARRRRTVALDEHAQEPVQTQEEETADDPLSIDPVMLEEALRGLPETQQAVVRMKYYVGLTFREIGEVLSISNNTAASRCRYALDALRELLRGQKKD